MAVHAARRRAAAPEHLHVVDPAVAEVVEVLETDAEIGQMGSSGRVAEAGTSITRATAGST
jgi:hypothetical protein